MPGKSYTVEEIARRGQAFYDGEIRNRVEKSDSGKSVVIDIETGEYEVDADDLAAFRRAEARNPEGLFHLLRIGHSAAHRLGARRSDSTA